MTEPTRAQQRCMIFKPARQVLMDSCDYCNDSETYCNSIYPRRCCGMCSHPHYAPEQ